MISRLASRRERRATRRGRRLAGIAIGSLVAVAGLASCQLPASKRSLRNAQPQVTWDGLVEARHRDLPGTFVRAGADFRAYDRLVLEPLVIPELEGAAPGEGLGGRTPEDGVANRERFASIFRESVISSLERGRYTVVDEAGPRALRAVAQLVERQQAPPEMERSDGRAKVMKTTSSFFLLAVELRDAESGEVLLRYAERSQSSSEFQRATVAGNWSDVKFACSYWGNRLRRRLDALRSDAAFAEALRAG